MWSSQYLLSLRERKQQKLKGTSTTGEVIQTGDVIILKPKTKRTTWLLGKVEKLIRRAKTVKFVPRNYATRLAERQLYQLVVVYWGELRHLKIDLLLKIDFFLKIDFSPI